MVHAPDPLRASGPAPALQDPHLAPDLASASGGISALVLALDFLYLVSLALNPWLSIEALRLGCVLSHPSHANNDTVCYEQSPSTSSTLI